MSYEGNLIEYGIAEEQSDYRAHVCFGEGYAYFYKTTDGVSAIENKSYRSRPARQDGVAYPTAMGYAVPVLDIPNVQRISIPAKWLAKVLQNVSKKSTTSLRGHWAMRVVQELLKRGHVPLCIGSSEVGDQRMQVEGADLFVWCKLRIQVKCDWDGGITGTGNLYLQTHECNPLKRT